MNGNGEDSIATFPMRFVSDFDQFLDYCLKKPVPLTKTTKTIARKHLVALNELLSVKAENANQYSSQELYPYIHFFFHLALAGRLIDVESRGEKHFLTGTKRTEFFAELTSSEKYCSLLEAFWVDLNWEQLHDQSFVLGHCVEIFARLRHESPGRSFNIANPRSEIEEFLKEETKHWQLFYKYFEWFGFWTCEADTDKIEDHYRKGSYFTKTITITNFGTAIMPILVFERNLYAWNIATRRMQGESEWFPGAPSEWIRNFGISQSDLACIEEIFNQDQSGEPFHLPFIPLFPEGTITNTLPRVQKRRQEGAYTFNVMYGTDIWRKLKLPGTCTMDDLHSCIIQAYDFEDDHLYSFFMDNKKWSNNCIASPHDDFGHADASKVHIDRYGFVQGQKFIYIFDYGAEWTFRVIVEEIDEQDTANFTPQLVGEEGVSPEQYFHGEWDE